ncbi:hypothetical protein [Aegicerativicinus sediminis]|uniref:hypothetical protein n=1 Tax=Aegicerativicinus sediminis TaxID=2893202 RepID=UPI001E2E4C66|nr:hypothetical protein [Aegicerativicinus sediminis]
MIRKHFLLIMAIIYWIFMMVGFSDNWLTQVDQESNSDLKFIIHGFIAFLWFSLLIAQNALVKSNHVNIHKKLGLLGLPLFYLLIGSVGYLVYYELKANGSLNALPTMVSVQAVVATIVITIGFTKRRDNPKLHKLMMTFGAFCLTQAAINRSIYWLFGNDYVFILSLIIMLLMLASFIWYSRRFHWFYGAWIISFVAGIVLVL